MRTLFGFPRSYQRLAGIALVMLAAAVHAVPPDDSATSRSDSDTHWAFRPVEEPPVPAIGDPWIRSPIDAFILEKLKQAGLEPSPRADRRTLLRRAHFGLTGLPPTYGDLESFEADDSSDPLAGVVDRLLASPTYGQHWARHWLDVARYADTKGYVFTANPRYPYAYTYRDYVIEALNEDLPYDQFVVEQIAADLIERPRNDRALAALGFLTVGRRFNNNQNDILDDRIDVITRGFLGLTVACARCHDHKYDPIPTADYYSLYGVLASCEEPDELPFVGDPTQHPGYERFKGELDRLRKRAENYLTYQHLLLSADLRNRIGEYVQIASEQIVGERGEKTPAHIKPRILERWEEFLTDDDRAKDPVWSVWAELAEIPADRFAQEANAKVQAMVSPGAEDGERPKNLLVASALLHEQPKSLADAAETIQQLFTAADSLWVATGNALLSAAELPAPVVLQVEKLLTAHGGEDASPESLRSQTLQRVLADLRALRDFLDARESPHTLARREVRRNLDVREKQQLERLFREADEFEAKSPDAPPRAMVVVDRPQPIEPRIFERGSPSRPGEPVPRQFLAALTRGERQPFEKGSGRLALAREIASASNPLTARVIVNRVWQHHFGEGIVPSASNFGIIGEPPSHPELLDWLAAKFVEHGWSIKWLHREIMRSATYQQSSAPPASQSPHSIDPENRLLWRQTRRRLDFEPLRDTLLAWSGRLDTSLGGQPFRLGEQPSTPRRTIYGLIDRQHLYEPLRYFDVASPDASADERPRTTVPQQALFLLNSPFVAEQARALVERLESEAHADPAAKLIALYRTVLLREPSPIELARAEAFLLAEAAASDSDSPNQPLTRLEQLAQTLMVCNEAVFID